jgi:thiosulfate/3-mercaptopyruvate sulfurtransferase
VDTVVIDARSFSRYNKGHLLGAINVDWTRNLENRIFKNKEDLSKIFSKIPKNAQIVTYCQGGYRAANAFLALKILGYKNVKMYVGSWGEWGNKVKLPIEGN